MQDILTGACVVSLFAAIGCQIWLILLIMRGNPVLALVALVVPFFTWYFAFQNWDIAKKPFLGTIAGLVLWLIFAFWSATS